MAPAATNHDPALAHQAPNPSAATQPNQTPNMQPELANVPLAGLDQQQIMNLLRHLPQVFNKVRISLSR